MTGHVSLLDAAWVDRRAEAGPPADDLALAAAAMRGEAGAFGALYERHLAGVYRFVHFRVRDMELAEDLTHDVFVSAYRHIGTLRAAASCRTWLLSIAHRRVLNHWRDQASRPMPADRLAESAADEAGPVVAAEDPALEAVGARLEAAGVLAAAPALTDLQQQVIALRFVAGLSVAETASAMERSVNAVKNLQHHALAALRRELGPGAGPP